MGGRQQSGATDGATHRRLALAILTLLGLTLLPLDLSAQGWLPDRRRAEGPGFRLGNLEIHPGLELEFGYDTNLFYTDDNPTGTWLMRANAHLDVSTIGEARSSEGEGAATESAGRRKVDFRGGGTASYNHFFEYNELDNVGANLGFYLVANPDGKYRLSIGDVYARSVEPFTDPSPNGSLLPDYVRNDNTARLEFSAHTPTDSLSGSLGYSYNWNGFAGESFSYANSQTHRADETVTWRFLPQTALVQQTVFSYRLYPEGEGGASLVTDGAWVDTRIGINGAITQKVSAAAFVGYSAGFFEGFSDFEGANLKAELRYRPRQTTQLTLTYDRRYDPSYIGNYVLSDRFTGRLQITAWGALQVGVRGMIAFDRTGLAIDEFGAPVGNQPRREDVVLTLATFAEYRATDWLALNLSATYEGDFTDFEFIDTTGPGSAIPDPSGAFQKFVIWLGARVFY